MPEYIERKAFLDYMKGTSRYFNVKFDIENFPAADVAPVVHGRWIKNNDSFQTDDYYCCYFDYNCSECGGIANDRYELPNYCPNCGAKMDL